MKIKLANEPKYPEKKEAEFSFGYYSHITQLKAAMEKLGVEFVDDADIVLHIAPLTWYEPYEGKKNIVFSMYEFESVPPGWVEKLKDIDLLIVPCEHNKRLFTKYYDVPCEVCLEGVDSAKFPYVERSLPLERPFRFYWFGALNLRKGYIALRYMWHEWKLLLKARGIKDNTELYIKCNDQHKEMIKHFEEEITFDNRILTDAQLQDLFAQAHCFVFPTMGEGFGLTLVEAISTGLPAIYTDYSGPCDYMNNEIGYPLPFEFTGITVKEQVKAYGGDVKQFDFRTVGAYPIMQRGVQAMASIYFHYDHALEKGSKAAQMVREKLTWEISAQRMIDIIGGVK